MAKKGTPVSDSKHPNGNPTEPLRRKPQRSSVGAATPRTITVRVSLTFGQRSRKLVLTPSGTPPWIPQRRRVDNTVVKALARAHRWKQMMESGKYASVTELAASERINDPYLCRMLRLTLLAPDIVESALDGRLTQTPDLDVLIRPISTVWSEQTRILALRVG